MQRRRRCGPRPLIRTSGTSPPGPRSNWPTAVSPRSHTQSVVFFTSNGSDSVDTAVKLVRRYWQVVGQPRRSTLIVRDHAYHGMHVGGTGLSGINANSAGYEDILSGVVRVPWNSADVLAKCIDEIGNEQVAAFFCEPVIGAGGVFAVPPGLSGGCRPIRRDRGGGSWPTR